MNTNVLDWMNTQDLLIKLFGVLLVLFGLALFLLFLLALLVPSPPDVSKCITLSAYLELFLFALAALVHFYVGFKVIKLDFNGIKKGIFVFGLIMIFYLIFSLLVSVFYAILTIILLGIWRYKFRGQSLNPGGGFIAFLLFFVVFFLFAAGFAVTDDSCMIDEVNAEFPIKEIKYKLDEAGYSLSIIKTTSEFVVGKDPIRTSVIAEMSQSGLGKDQTCFIKSKTITNSALDTGDGSVFKNNGGNTKVKFSVICNKYSSLQEDFDTYFGEDASSLINCSSFKSLEEEEIACVIVVRNPSD